MRILLDTQIVLWSAAEPDRLSRAVQDVLEDADNDVVFSVANLWEVAIKRALDRPDFRIDPAWLRSQLLAAGYEELPMLAAHAVAVAGLPALHRDPFDRILIAQAQTEGLTLLTADAAIARYPGPIQRI